MTTAIYFLGAVLLAACIYGIAVDVRAAWRAIRASWARRAQG